MRKERLPCLHCNDIAGMPWPEHTAPLFWTLREPPTRRGLRSCVAQTLTGKDADAAVMAVAAPGQQLVEHRRRRLAGFSVR